MKFTITLSPQVWDNPTLINMECAEHSISINGDVLDLSVMAVGDTLPPLNIEHPLFRTATIHCTDEGYEIDGLIFPISANQTDEASCFPDIIEVTQPGPVNLPAQLPTIEIGS